MGTWQRVAVDERCWSSAAAALYFGTLYVLGMRVRHLRVQAPPRPRDPRRPPIARSAD